MAVNIRSGSCSPCAGAFMLFAFAQYMKLDYSCIRYVLESMDHTTSRIRNMHAYLRTALYNAVNTVSNFISAEVNADLYGIES